MTDGSSQGLLVVVAVVIFGIFVLISYVIFKDTLKPSLARIYCDAFTQAEKMTGITGSTCGDGGSESGGGDENSTGTDDFLNSSKMVFSGNTVFYYGQYIYGSSEGIISTKFNQSGDTYKGSYTIDLSKYSSMSGMDMDNWNGLMVQNNKIAIEFSDEDLALIDENWLAETNNGQDVQMNNVDENSHQINLSSTENSATVYAEVKMKDGSTKRIEFTINTKNNLYNMDEFKENYVSKVNTTAVIKGMDDSVLYTTNLSLEHKQNGEATITIDTGGKVTIDNYYNYMLGFENSKMIIKDSDDFYKLGGYQYVGSTEIQTTEFTADMPDGASINEIDDGFEVSAYIGSEWGTYSDLKVIIK